MSSGGGTDPAAAGEGAAGVQADRKRLRVLAIAFACDPERGSESAGGWGTVNALAEFADVTVLHHPRHTENIDAWRRQYPESQRHLTYVPVETVAWGLRAQRIKPLTQMAWRARYLGWLRVAQEVGERLHAQESFDAALHASLGIYWLPSTVVDLPMPTVWGPVSGAAPSPPQLRRYGGVAGFLAERAELASAAVLARLPWTRRTWRRATFRLTESANVYTRLPEDLRDRSAIANRAILSSIRDVPAVPRKPYLLFTSPLERRKAPALALHALARTPEDVRLLFIHRGPEQKRLEALAGRLGVRDRVEFLGRVPRDEMWARIAETAGCVFTGLREEGGCALAEAMLAGAPVTMIDHGGAGLLAAAATDPERMHAIRVTTPERTVDDLAAAMTSMAHHPSEASGPYLDQETTKGTLRFAVEQAIQVSSQGG